MYFWQYPYEYGSRKELFLLFFGLELNIHLSCFCRLHLDCILVEIRLGIRFRGDVYAGRQNGIVELQFLFLLQFFFRSYYFVYPDYRDHFRGR